MYVAGLKNAGIHNQPVTRLVKQQACRDEGQPKTRNSGDGCRVTWQHACKDARRDRVKWQRQPLLCT